MTKWGFIKQYRQELLNSLPLEVNLIFSQPVPQISCCKCFVDFAQDFHGTFVYSLQISGLLYFYVPDFP